MDIKVGDLVRVTQEHWGLDVDGFTIFVTSTGSGDFMGAYIASHPIYQKREIMFDPEKVEMI